MQKSKLVINTLVYQKDIEQGKRQHELFYDIKQLGMTNVEVRREYIQTDQEFLDMSITAKDLGMTLFYSVPDKLFADHRLRQDLFKKYIDEAQVLNAKIVKFNKGDYLEWHDEDITAFQKITESFQGLVTVENDQTEENGKMKALLSFYQDCQLKDIAIDATFDMGNSLWVDELPLENAKRISKYAKYVHIKDVSTANDVLIAAYLGDGVLPWKEILQEFSEDLYFAIEYPCGDDPTEVIKKEIAKFLEL